MQSYGGVLRLFPAWPPQVAAEFTTFRAEGAFLVSARWADGAVAACEVRSERGGPCRLFSPWPAGLKVETAQGAAVSATRSAEGIHSFETVAGETYRVRPL